MKHLSAAIVFLALTACETPPERGSGQHSGPGIGPPISISQPITATPPVSAQRAVESFALPAPAQLDPSARRSIWATSYVAWPASESTSSDAVPLLDRDGREFGVRLSHRDWCNAAMEGTVNVALQRGGSRTFNFHSTRQRTLTDCSDVFPRADPRIIAAVSRSVFFEVPPDAPLGMGASSRYRLVPYRSIAADPSLELGTVMYIPNLRGASITLADGRQVTHDGYVIVVDRGGAIRGAQIDFFKGLTTDDRPPSAIRSSADRQIDAYLIEDPAIKEVLLRPHLRSSS